MAKMKLADIQRTVKENVFSKIMETFSENGEQYNDYEIAVPVEVDGKEYWGKVSVICGQVKDTKKTKAFDPFKLQEEWQIDKEIKRKQAEADAKAKAEKIARSKSKK